MKPLAKGVNALQGASNGFKLRPQTISKHSKPAKIASADRRPLQNTLNHLNRFQTTPCRSKCPQTSSNQPEPLQGTSNHFKAPQNHFKPPRTTSNHLKSFPIASNHIRTFQIKHTTSDHTEPPKPLQTTANHIRPSQAVSGRFGPQ